jgi:hypothetical protein
MFYCCKWLYVASALYSAGAKVYVEHLPPSAIQIAYANLKKWTDQLTEITVLVTFFGLCLLGGLGYVIYRERKNAPLFTPLMVEGRDQGSSSAMIEMTGKGTHDRAVNDDEDA